MCLPLFFCPPPRRAGQHRPRLSRSCAAPAFPLLRRLRLSRACHQARAPALISAQLYFLTPLYFFRPAQGEVKKTPSYLPNFCALEPAKLNVRARSTYRARAGAGGRSAGDRRRGGLPGVGAGRWCSAGCCVFGCGRCAGCRCWGWCWCGGGVVLAGELLPGAACGGRPAGWWCGVNSGKKKSPCRR